MFRLFALTALAALGISSTASAQFVYLPRVTPAVVVAPRPYVVHHNVHHYHVQYRSPWEEHVFTCPIEARAFERRQELLGYQAHTSGHGPHFHVRYRLPGWQPYRTVGSDFHAHQLERQLELRGLNARVVHH
jgi:hypothetical protein